MPIGSVDLSVVVFLFILCVCLFVQLGLRISPARIKLAASNFARWFMGVLGRETPILGELFSPRGSSRCQKSDQSTSDL